MKITPKINTKSAGTLLRTTVATCLLAMPVALHATTYFWDADGTGPTPLNYGSGTLSTSTANWTTNGTTYVGWTNSTADTIQIGSNTGGFYTGGSTAAAFTLTLGGAITAGQIVVSGNLSSGNTVTFTDGGTSSNTLSLGGVGVIQNNSASNSLIIDTQIVAAPGTGLTDSSIGTVIFTKNNTYTGGTIIQGGGSSVGGVLQVGNGGTSGSLGSGTVSFALNGQTSATTLRYNRSDAVTVSNAVSVASTNTVGAIIQQSGSNTLKFTGNVTLNNSTSTLTYNIADNAQAIDTEVSGVISGGGKIAKSGTGTLLFSGVNTYTGTTTVAGGTLSVGGSLAAGSAVTVQNLGTLIGTGTVNGTVAVQSGGFIAPGSGIGTLTTGNVSLASGSTFSLEINIASASSVTSDKLVSGTLDLASTSDSKLVLSNLGSNIALNVGLSFTILDYTGTWDGDVFQVGGVAIADGGQFTFGANTFSIDYNAGPSLNDVVLTVVPEPNTWVMVAAGFGLLIAVQRFRFSPSKAC